MLCRGKHTTNQSWQYFAPLSFPQALTLRLRVVELGKSSVSYEVGVFAQDSDSPAAVGGYTHVFVDSISLQSGPMETQIRQGLEKICLKPTTTKL